ncbi:response regulator [Marinimicrobium sp. ARAG 43.8]|uniref:response regulator n=1 Tax=Marinimicrobium sp. ARAG 43.8 TaxID=3418719 RepID=UPI003CEFA11D
MSRETILLVEDNPDEAELALFGFGQVCSDYDVQLVPNGEEALDFLFARGQHAGRAEQCKPSLIILDIDLPRVSGFDVLKAVRGAAEYRFTPVVILTTSDEQADILQGYQLGVNSYLCKPVDFESFADLLQQVSHYWLRTNTRPGSGGRAS